MNEVMLAGGGRVRLGRIRPKNIVQTEDKVITVLHDGTVKMTPRLGAYFAPHMMAAPPPKSTNWAAKAMASLNRMYLNDQMGTCAIAGKYHLQGVWSGNDSPTVIVGTDQEVLAAYRTICGPGDNGCYITRVMDWWRDRGLVFSGVNHKIDGYVAVDWTNRLLVQVAIYVFGGALTLGVNLPSAWQCTNCKWDVNNSQMVGGHDVPVVDYNEEGVVVSTWGGLATITWPAFLSKRYVEECYLALGPAWYGNDKTAPNGINAQMLAEALRSIGSGTIPPLPDPGPPPVPDPPGPLPPTPVPPYPQTYTINVPQQPVMSNWGSKMGYVPAHKLTGVIGGAQAREIGYQASAPDEAGAVQLRIPPFLLAELNRLCASGMQFPGIFGMIVPYLCKLIPPTTDPSDPMFMSAGIAGFPTITVPPWFIGILRFACSQTALLPPPYDEIAHGLCALLPPARLVGETPCGCKETP